MERTTLTATMTGKEAVIRPNDMILAKNQYYSLDCYETQLNNNVLVVGTSGSGKTRSIVTPNLLQATGSYIVSDPKGNLYKKYRKYLEAKGYVVKKLDFVHPERSSHYNFFNYIHSERDILKIAHMLIYSEKRVRSSADPFWDQAAELLLTAVIGYLHYHGRPKEKNMESVLKLISVCQINENDSEIKSPLDRLMDEVGRRNYSDFSYKQYQKFRLAAGRTLKSILITITGKLGKYDFTELNKMMAHDDIDIASIGQKKTALFVVVSDTDRSLDDLANLFFTQAMNELCAYADDECEDNRLPVDVRFIMDDFATNCKINDFPKMIASIRSRGISTMLMIQSESQLTAGYGEDDRTIIGNCDTYIYLGGNDVDTAKQVAIRCDLPLKRILEMPVGSNWIFRRGQAAVHAKNFDLEAFLAQKMKELCTEKSVCDVSQIRENTSGETGASEQIETCKIPGINMDVCVEDAVA